MLQTITTLPGPRPRQRDADGAGRQGDGAGRGTVRATDARLRITERAAREAVEAFYGRDPERRPVRTATSARTPSW